jgi:hypothetical protein
MNRNAAVVISDITMSSNPCTEIHVLHIGIERQTLVKWLSLSYIKTDAHTTAISAAEFSFDKVYTSVSIAGSNSLLARSIDIPRSREDVP